MFHSLSKCVSKVSFNRIDSCGGILAFLIKETLFRHSENELSMIMPNKQNSRYVVLATRGRVMELSKQKLRVHISVDHRTMNIYLAVTVMELLMQESKVFKDQNWS
jgi:hypothetical protein